MKYPEVIYFENELEDEFSKGGINPIKIDENYRYEGGKFRSVSRAVFYHVLAKIIAGLYLPLGWGHKVYGREKMRGYKSFFLYGNHTNPVADALIPTMLNPGKSTYVIVHPDNVSMPVLGKITPSLGAIPLPDDRKAYKNFLLYIDKLVEKKRVIMIYPEAHIWPFYTHIRPFKHDSFHYPVKYNTPVFCFTNTYQKRKFLKKPKIVTYVSGPFFPDESLSKPDRTKKLRDEVYDAMVKNSSYNTVELIKYIRKENEQ
ncbi:MAG: 1-acyl-sn-glycerol-3-phosphate acyltransferase [Lachnospiraceae bacterium]|nr:1-acyl-sn-glycerol-3-phosphate acyltransferase [Lachnospiraceae bacterium]